jgi:hypothetical protein
VGEGCTEFMVGVFTGYAVVFAPECFGGCKGYPGGYMQYCVGVQRICEGCCTGYEVVVTLNINISSCTGNMGMFALFIVIK